MTEVAVRVATDFWKAVDARAWDRVRDLLGPDVVVTWPQSGERFGRREFLAVNEEYPGDWRVRVVHAVGTENGAVTEVDVDIDGRVDRAVSLLRVEDGRIVEIREYWPDPFPVPEWRTRLLERLARDG